MDGFGAASGLPQQGVGWVESEDLYIYANPVVAPEPTIRRGLRKGPNPRPLPCREGVPAEDARCEGEGFFFPLPPGEGRPEGRVRERRQRIEGGLAGVFVSGMEQLGTNPFWQVQRNGMRLLKGGLAGIS